MVVAIILAGGVGKRVGYDVPKQFIRVEGKPILIYTLELFQRNKSVDAIEIVSHPDYVDQITAMCEEYSITKKKWICVGGESFQHSVMNGVFNLKKALKKNDIIVISFGVSPLTPQEDIDDSIRVCKIHGNGVAASSIDLCTCIKKDENSSVQAIERENLMGFANPWSFKFGEICEIYEEAIRTGIIKDIEPHTTSLYLALGKRIWFSKSTAPQCKITSKSDIDIFKGYLMVKKMEKINDNI